jgi:hypothetical protein
MLFNLDRRGIQETYALDATALDDWRGVYDALSGYRFAYGLDPQDGLLAAPSRAAYDLGAFKEHLAYAVDRGSMAAIDLTPDPRGVAAIPKPATATAQDALQLYLRDMAAWLRQQGWLDRAYLRPSPMGPRDQWPNTRAAFDRGRRADDRIRLLMTGGVHPYFEAQADIWAVPIPLYNATIHSLLLRGDPLSAKPAFDAQTVTASSSGTAPRPGSSRSRPEDAYDGSLHTAWWSEAAPSPAKPQRLRLNFSKSVAADSFRVGWRGAFEPVEMIVRTALDGKKFNRSSVRWDHHDGGPGGMDAWSEAHFQGEKRFLAIEIEFRKSRADTRVAVTELEFGPPKKSQYRPAHPKALWIQGTSESAPFLKVGSPPMDARMIPWIAWGQQADGWIAGTVSATPQIVTPSTVPGHASWLSTQTINELFYPDGGGLISSIRAHLLRDGLEDYEYLSAFRRIAPSRTANSRKAMEAARPRLYGNSVPRHTLDEIAKEIPAWRVHLGRAISKLGAR